MDAARNVALVRKFFRMASYELAIGLAVVVAWWGFAYDYWSVHALGANFEMALLAVQDWCQDLDGLLGCMVVGAVLLCLGALHIRMAVLRRPVRDD